MSSLDYQAVQDFRTARFQANYIHKEGDASAEILKEAKQQACDLIIMGSYGQHSAIIEVALGSTIDEVLRTSENSVLICR
jgi:nucleotide-binding universal stress UspA family protein